MEQKVSFDRPAGSALSWGRRAERMNLSSEDLAAMNNNAPMYVHAHKSVGVQCMCVGYLLLVCPLLGMPSARLVNHIAPSLGGVRLVLRVAPCTIHARASLSVPMCVGREGRSGSLRAWTCHTTRLVTIRSQGQAGIAQPGPPRMLQRGGGRGWDQGPTTPNLPAVQ